MPLSIENHKINQFQELLRNKRRIVILSHSNPDGDAVGSVLGLAHILCKNLALSKKNISVVLPNPAPDTFFYLPGFCDIIDADHQMDVCKNVFMLADLVIGVDFNMASRVGALQKLLEDSTCPKVLIDHHHSPDENMFDLIFSKVDFSSTCELIYWVAFNTWQNDALNQDAAKCLYTGICTDTGNFAFANGDSSLYEATAELVKFDIKPAEIHNHIFNAFSVAKMQFFGFCINQRLRIFEKEGVAYFYLTQEDLNRFGVKESDTEGLVNYTLMMKQIHVGALIKDSQNRGVRISLRSKNDFDVKSFAERHFAGGGHTKAAGATSRRGFEATVELLEKELLKEVSVYNEAHVQ